MNPLKTGPWNLADLKNVIPNGKKVFSCFHCGGGSTMGYKLAGYEVLGGIEIDQKMMQIYKLNHNPKYSYLMGVQQFKNIPNEDLPKELFELDILDGSPPCSSFSMVGSREDAWGDKKKFREDQAEQVLDDLFFDFIDIAEKLKPKIVVAENVKGLMIGKAKGYVKQIYNAFNKAGYDVQLFLLNAAFMGVPQKRERTFFIARRRDLKLDKISITFKEEIIPFSEIKESKAKPDLNDRLKKLWNNKKKSDLDIGFINERLFGKNTGFATKIQKDELPLYTITASGRNILYSEPRHLTKKEVISGQTFPEDYNFSNLDTKYVCGMSVPPFMMQRVADQIYKQWLVQYG